jgi:hypothetical protein
LYQLCTGRVPFDADTPYAVILKHISAPLPSPRSQRPDLPKAVERVILKAMAKEPDDRFQKAGEMGRTLRAAVKGSLDSSPSPRRGFWHKLLKPFRRPTRTGKKSVILQTGLIVLLTIFACIVIFFVTRSWRIERYLASLTPLPSPTAVPADMPVPMAIPEPELGPVVLEIEGPEKVQDTWINPDVPNELFHDFDLVHLQGPLTPDRILLRFDLSDLPEGAEIISATLATKVDLWGEESFPGAAVAYRVLTAWDAAEATYNSPWSTPGMIAGIDYDQIPLDLVPIPDEGYLLLDVSEALRFWRGRGEPNYGVVIMMSEDSHNWAHHWVYLSEQPAPADRPTLRIAYEGSP